MSPVSSAPWLAPLASGLITWALLWWMLRNPGWALPLDLPNPRSLHAQPVPRTGGIGIMAGLVIGAGFAGPAPLWLLALSAGLALVSFLDDLRGLAAQWRFLAHFLAAALFMLWAFPAWSWPGLAVAVLAAVWMTNLYNFMDGSDGLAGGMAVFGFSAYGAAAWLGGEPWLAVTALSAAAAAAAFLVFNFPPARIFMGDAGSIPMGFLAAALGLLGWEQRLWPLWFPVLVFSPFIVDASATLARRLLRREKIWQAHKSHYYQRLVRMGWGHRNTALAEYAVMIAAGASALWGSTQSGLIQLGLCAGWAMVYAVLAILIDRHWAQHQSSQSNPCHT